MGTIITTETALQFVEQIRANVDAWYDRNEITQDEMRARNRRTWDQVAAAGSSMLDEVHRILREQPRED